MVMLTYPFVLPLVYHTLIIKATVKAHEPFRQEKGKMHFLRPKNNSSLVSKCECKHI